MTPQEVALALDGNEYGKEIAEDLEERVRDAGIVVVFGASDDLMEFRGAINDEVGETAYLTKKGLVVAECEDDDCPHEKRIREGASVIKAKWCEVEGFSWTYETEIPHETFIIREGDENYCRGIVFDLADVPAA